jgi:hypothetical protein
MNRREYLLALAQEQDVAKAQMREAKARHDRLREELRFVVSVPNYRPSRDGWAKLLEANFRSRNVTAR